MYFCGAGWRLSVPGAAFRAQTGAEKAAARIQGRSGAGEEAFPRAAFAGFADGI